MGGSKRQRTDDEAGDTPSKRRSYTLTSGSLPCEGAEAVPPGKGGNGTWHLYLRGMVVAAFNRTIPDHLHAKLVLSRYKDPEYHENKPCNMAPHQVHDAYVAAQRVLYCHIDGVHQRAERRQELGLAADAELPPSELNKIYPEVQHPRRDTIIEEQGIKFSGKLFKVCLLHYIE